MRESGKMMLSPFLSEKKTCLGRVNLERAKRVHGHQDVANVRLFSGDGGGKKMKG